MESAVPDVAGAQDEGARSAGERPLSLVDTFHLIERATDTGRSGPGPFVLMVELIGMEPTQTNQQPCWPTNEVKARKTKAIF